MQLTEVQVQEQNGPGRIVAKASFVLAGELDGVPVRYSVYARIIKRRDGSVFLAMPSEKIDDRYHDVFRAIGHDSRAAIEKPVLDAYQVMVGEVLE